MRYLGSKGALAERIFQIVTRHVATGTFCDPFGGIGCVGSYFKSAGFRVVTGDVLRFAHLFQVTRISLNRLPNFTKLRTALRVGSRDEIVEAVAASPRPDGWFTREYAAKRHFFTRANATKIESCWKAINRWSARGLLNRNEHAVLLASLIDSADRVANTAGTYYAFLKTWYRKALNRFEFRFLSPAPGASGCAAYLCDALDLVKRVHADVLYLDPPYNERSYAHYYHLPETLAAGAATRVHGLSGIPDAAPRLSPYNRRSDAADALRELLGAASSHIVAVHYSPDGLISERTIRSLLSTAKDVQCYSLQALGYTTRAQSRSTPHVLYVAVYA